MRRTFVIIAVAAIALTGCGGGGGSKSSSAAKSSGSGTGSLSGSFCGDSTAAAQQQLTLAPGTDASTLQKNLNLLKKFENEAPSAIKGDVTTLVNAYGQIVTALSSANNDPAKMAAALAPLQGQQASLQAASQRITAYVASHCH